MVAWDHPHMGQLYMLPINQEIYIPHLENHIVSGFRSQNPLTMRCTIIINGLGMNELPKVLADNSDEDSHALKVTDPLDDDSTLTIPFRPHVLTTHLPVRKPIVQEYNKNKNTLESSYHPRNQCRIHLIWIMHMKKSE